MSQGTDITQVQQQDPSLENSPVSGPIEEESTVRLDQAGKACLWNGQAFAQGDKVQLGEQRYECAFGTWVPLPD